MQVAAWLAPLKPHSVTIMLLMQELGGLCTQVFQSRTEFYSELGQVISYYDNQQI